MGRAIVHKLVSSTAPARTDNNPTVSLWAFKDKRQPRREERTVPGDSWATFVPRRVQTRTPGRVPASGGLIIHGGARFPLPVVSSRAFTPAQAAAAAAPPSFPMQSALPCKPEINTDRVALG